MLLQDSTSGGIPTLTISAFAFSEAQVHALTCLIPRKTDLCMLCTQHPADHLIDFMRQDFSDKRWTQNSWCLCQKESGCEAQSQALQQECITQGAACWVRYSSRNVSPKGYRKFITQLAQHDMHTHHLDT